jgi:hypothetical protein
MRRLSVRIAVTCLVRSMQFGDALITGDATEAKHDGATLLLEKFP